MRMPRKWAAKSLKRLVKLLIASFVIYLFLVIHIYNLLVAQVRLRKEPQVVYYKLKYILLFSEKDLAPFNFMGEGTSAFVINKCKYKNCFVTDNRNLLNETDFDAIVFNGRNIIKLGSQVPEKRSLRQKYIFGATESADRFPACSSMFDNFFNWTWTYKLESDFRWGYITIYDIVGNKVGPAIDMKWPQNMEPISEDVKEKLSRKSKAAAWFVSHCKTESRREDFVSEVNEVLDQYGHKVDVYGSCGELSCPRTNKRDCDRKVEIDYYFYFSLENSFAEDYVTEKLLTALNNYAVPVVFGGADYSRFLPEGSYLDGRQLGAKKLARIMLELMADKTKYYEYFRWRSHFTYAETISNMDVCNICDALNDDQMVNTVSVWKNFREWWNTERHKNICP